MGETLRQPSYPTNGSEYSVEGEPNIEAEKHLTEIFKLLGKLIERVGDLPSATKKRIRAQVKQHLNALGIESLDDYKKLAEIHARVEEEKRTLPNPPDYPEKEEFEKTLAKLYLSKDVEPIPVGVMDDLFASDIAAYGQCDWSEVEGRGGRNALDYLYDLGKVMTSKLAYEAAFDESDPIVVGKGWKIENGRHRSMALRALGNLYVNQKGMDTWVKAVKEN